MLFNWKEDKLLIKSMCSTCVLIVATNHRHVFPHVQVPPGVLFHWKKDMLLVKATKQREYGWMLIGMLQFDPSGRAAFMHRTIDKFRWDGQPAHIGLITGPLPYRCALWTKGLWLLG